MRYRTRQRSLRKWETVRRLRVTTVDPWKKNLDPDPG
jgi:hypothetical protein